MEPAEKSKRLMEAASAILSAAPNHKLNVVVLNKALFYLDLASIRDHQISFTNNSYVAIQNGPVVAKYQERLIGGLEREGIAKQIEEWNGAKPMLLESPTEYKILDAETVGLATAVTTYFASLSSRAASEYSHDNPGWQVAWNKYQRTGKPAAVNMHIALQQIVEDDPWMSVPIKNDTEILALADAGDGVDW